jgi:large subunit ribosomal protein L22
MIEVLAKTRYLRMSARKVRLVVDLIRGMSVSSALDQLHVVPKLAARPVEKTVRSAIANASHNFRLSEDKLFIKKITVDQGPSLDRWRPRAFGKAAPIKKHSCHITVVVAEKEEAPMPEKSAVKKTREKQL